LPLEEINSGIAHLAARSTIRTNITPFKDNSTKH
jgi:hypothetical protein